MEENEKYEIKNCKRKAATTASINISEVRLNSSTKKVSSLLRKRKKQILSEEDIKFLEENQDHVKQFYKRQEKRAVLQIRQSEHEDSEEVLQEKCLELAQAIHDAEFLVVYTGAGISTSASIPDYRGPNGIWTKLQKGEDIGRHDISAAIPTSTHMALSHLFRLGMVKHVVSQNCDGLHLRSGLPKTSMSEVHGNMYIEVCRKCSPAREYVRTFDVTEKTSTFKHATGRRCYKCGEPLIDSIVHFGERGRLRWPLNWQGACQAANACDTILCLGSSLKVLRKYTWLWQLNRPARKRPRLYVVNLQWTPKDKDATLKINGKCDIVMKNVMKFLGLEIETYRKENDPIFNLATPLNSQETSTTTQPILSPDYEQNIKIESSDSECESPDDKLRVDVKKEIYPVDDRKIKRESKMEIKMEDGNKLKKEPNDSPIWTQQSSSSNDFSGFEDNEVEKKFVKRESALAEINTMENNAAPTKDNTNDCFRDQFYGTGLCIRSELNQQIDYSSSDDSNTVEFDSVDDQSTVNSESDFSVKCEQDSSECEDRSTDLPGYPQKEILYGNGCHPFQLIFSNDGKHSSMESDKENEPLVIENLERLASHSRKEGYIKLYEEEGDQKGIDITIKTNNLLSVNHSEDQRDPNDSIFTDGKSFEDSERDELKAIWVDSFTTNESNPEDSSNNEDIKNIWFWGFDTQLEENQESVTKLRTLEMAMEKRESPVERRVTRSSKKSPVTLKFKCKCAAANEQLCANKMFNVVEPDDAVTKCRDIFRRKRTLNYKGFEPRFELLLTSVTFERKKRARKQWLSKDYQEDKDDSNDAEAVKPKDNITNPGWYGKGYRRTIKKKKSQS